MDTIDPMKAERRCAAPGCKNKFVPVREIQRYCSLRCKNREAARRQVKRSQKITGRDRIVGSIPTVRSSGTPRHASPAPESSRKASRPVQIAEGREPDNPLAEVLGGFVKDIADEPDDDKKIDPWTGKVEGSQ